MCSSFWINTCESDNCPKATGRHFRCLRRLALSRDSVFSYHSSGRTSANRPENGKLTMNWPRGKDLQRPITNAMFKEARKRRWQRSIHHARFRRRASNQNGRPLLSLSKHRRKLSLCDRNEVPEGCTDE